MAHRTNMVAVLAAGVDDEADFGNTDILAEGASDLMVAAASLHCQAAPKGSGYAVDLAA